MANVHKTDMMDIVGHVPPEPSPGLKNSSISGRSIQSFAGIRSDFHNIESFGFQIPILVSEALTFNENTQISMTYSENSWAWMVHGRRLLIWQYKEMQSANKSNYGNKNLGRPAQRRIGTIAQCRELSLPHCDIGHKATLVRVFLSQGQQMASCLAVSPTGDVRYWPSIAHDGSSVDSGGILDGQEFDQLLELPQQMGYLLVTTTCSLALLQLQFVHGRHVLNHKAIRPPSGFLGNIGKKFASIIIGINNSGDKENKLVSIGCEQTADGIICNVLADHMVQCWRFGNGEELLYEDSELIRIINDEFQDKFWNLRESTNIEVNLLDMQLKGGKMFVFAGAVNMASTPKMCYGVAVFSFNASAASLTKFIPIKLNQFYNNNTKAKCLSFRLLICNEYLYIYNKQFIYPLNLSKLHCSNIEAEKIEFCFEDDAILSGIVCDQSPIFFNRTHGFLCVNPGDVDSFENLIFSYPAEELAIATDDGLHEQLAFNLNNNLILSNFDPEEMLKEFADADCRIKAAFIYHLKHNYAMCKLTLNEVYNTVNGNSRPLGETQELDRIVVQIVEELADDIPAADPRWKSLRKDKGDNAYALGSSNSLQILTQLKDKKVALRHFIEFLHAMEIWEKLGVVSDGDIDTKSTCYQIADTYEKIVAATTLRTLYNKFPKVLDEAIVHTVKMWGDAPNTNLTVHDLFFVQTSKLQVIFQSFCDIAEEKIAAHHTNSLIAAFLQQINTIVLTLVHSVLKSREQNADVLTANKRIVVEYLPWTTISGKMGIRDALSHLIDLTVQHGVRNTVDTDLKQKFYQQILEMIDFILDGRKKYLESLNDVEKYNVLQQQFESLRRDLISIFINDGQYEHAAKLAEKYLDFHSLIVICDKTNSQDRLDNYIMDYDAHNFSQFAINWHLRQNRQSEVFKRFKENQTALSEFMRNYPMLGWIQLTFNGDFERASRILFQLANGETEFLHRKKSMLSLAKLATFAAADSDITTQVSNINAELTMVDYQEHLNESVLEIFGYDSANQRVMKLEEIIDVFISNENEQSTEYDFRKAIELLRVCSKLMTFEKRNEIYHKIWCAAILRDNWIDYDVNDAANYLQKLFFFKLIEVCFLLDGDMDSFIPPLEEFLKSTELRDLPQNLSFQYLIKLVYEFSMDLYVKEPIV